MKHKERTRLWALGRWGVWVCTGLLAVVMVASMRGGFGVWVDHRDSGVVFGAGEFRVDARDGRLTIYVSSWWVGNPSPSSRFLWTGGWCGAGEIEESVGLRWWDGPRWFGVGNRIRMLSDGVDVPLVYPVVFLGVWSGWLFWGRRRVRVWGRSGRCVGCGYSLEGLDGGVCPECGDGVEE